jgi:hypothetical protein
MDLAGQYLSQPQQMSSGLAGCTGNRFVMDGLRLSHRFDTLGHRIELTEIK